MVHLLFAFSHIWHYIALSVLDPASPSGITLGLGEGLDLYFDTHTQKKVESDVQAVYEPGTLTLVKLALNSPDNDLISQTETFLGRSGRLKFN